jgi:hypothetical protein
MPSSGKLSFVALVRTDVSEERIASIIRVTRINNLLKTLALTSSPILVTLMMEAKSYYETSVLTKVTRRGISGDGILRSEYCPILYTETLMQRDIRLHVTGTLARRRNDVLELPSRKCKQNSTRRLLAT